MVSFILENFARNSSVATQTAEPMQMTETVAASMPGKMTDTMPVTATASTPRTTASLSSSAAPVKGKRLPMPKRHRKNLFKQKNKFNPSTRNRVTRSRRMTW